MKDIPHCCVTAFKVVFILSPLWFSCFPGRRWRLEEAEVGEGRGRNLLEGECYSWRDYKFERHMGDLNPFPDILHIGHGQIVLSFWASISTSASCNSNTSFLTLLWKLEAMLPKSALGIDWHIWWHSALLLLLSLLWLVWIWLEWHRTSERGCRRENPKETSGRVNSVSMPFGPQPSFSPHTWDAQGYHVL